MLNSAPCARLWLILFLLSCSELLAEDDIGQRQTDRAGFIQIFDGHSLQGWDGDSKYWSVADGCLVGTVTPETLLQKNSWIVWRGGLVEDFELVLDYRISAQGNSGVGYRLATLEDDPFSVRGPQADIHGGDQFTGICYEENGRRLLAGRGQTTWIGEAGELPQLVAQFAHPQRLQTTAKKEDWNRYRLVVCGNRAQHFLNGVLMSEVYDHDETNRMHRGLVGVQVHVGPPMKVEFRDVYLKHLGEAPEDDAGRESVTYQMGRLAEPQHQATFEHLVQQTRRFTAPPAREPLDGSLELRIQTRDLALVRHDLVDVDLFGTMQSGEGDEQPFDLVITTGDRTIRIPEGGELLRAEWPDRAYRVALKWDATKKEYAVLECEPLASDP